MLTGELGRALPRPFKASRKKTLAGVLGAMREHVERLRLSWLFWSEKKDAARRKTPGGWTNEIAWAEALFDGAFARWQDAKAMLEELERVTKTRKEG